MAILFSYSSVHQPEELGRLHAACTSFPIEFKAEYIEQNTFIKHISAANVNANVKFSRESQAGTIIVQRP